MSKARNSTKPIPTHSNDFGAATSATHWPTNSSSTNADASPTPAARHARSTTQMEISVTADDERELIHERQIGERNHQIGSASRLPTVPGAAGARPLPSPVASSTNGFFRSAATIRPFGFSGNGGILRAAANRATAGVQRHTAAGIDPADHRRPAPATRSGARDLAARS